MHPRILALGLAALCVSARAADLIPIEDFARPAMYSDVRLSPDGQYCAFLREVDGYSMLDFASLAEVKVRGFDLGHGEVAPGKRDVLWYRWLGSKRVLVGIGVWDMIEGTAAYDRDGTNWQAIGGVVGYGSGVRLNYHPLKAYHAIHSFNDNVHALMLETRGDDGDKVRLYPHVINVNTETGSFDQVATNPGNVIAWMPDRHGVVRAGIECRSIEETAVIYREDEKSPWRPLTVLSHNPKESPILQGFSADGKGLYISATNTSGYRVFFLCDLATGKLGEPLLEAPGYDVKFSHSSSQVCTIWSESKQAIVGYSYVTDGPHIKWFDDDYARNMAVIDSVRTDTANLPVSSSDQDRRILVFSYSDRNPGAYYLYTPQDKKLEGIVRTRPWIKPEQMASMNPITYTARDGLEIHGYLTIPLGQKPRNLPLVVMPHGGPWVRDIWGYDPLVQMLANRGYAVLQMNYRGSAGYGAKFSKKGEREVGGAIQQDIDDATRWAIAKRVADPKRIAIVGASYGGYSALYALGKSIDLYCCGISIAGVTDWLSIYENASDPEYQFAREHWIREIGDPEKDEERLKAISPVNFADKIVAPLLIIQGKEDNIVPPKQAKKIIAALEKAGRKPQSLFIADEGHGFRKEKSRLQEYKAIEAFLAKHLGPGATSADFIQATAPAAVGSAEKK
jgi:dipeptidyl aminopeptidase/acylaminoacyl peptidase